MKLAVSSLSSILGPSYSWCSSAEYSFLISELDRLKPYMPDMVRIVNLITKERREPKFRKTLYKVVRDAFVVNEVGPWWKV